MTKDKPFSSTFKLEKETKNTVRYAEEAEGAGQWWARCTSTSTNWGSRIRSGSASPLSPRNRAEIRLGFTAGSLWMSIEWMLTRKAKVQGRQAVGGRIFQVRIALKGIHPPIWRRVQVPGTIRLAVFHDVIQTVFLHQFFVGGRAYGQPDDFDEAVIDETRVTLAQAVGTRVKRFAYVYDFGDNWEHEALVEKVIAGNSGSERPWCLGGKRHRPPEDCGGPPGYANFLDAIGDRRHPEHKAMLEWVGGGFDSEAFNLAAVNRELAELSLERWRVQ